MEKTLPEAAFVDRTVWEVLDASALWVLVGKSTLNARAIGVSEDSVTVLHAVAPCARVHRAVPPLARPEASHAPHLPLTFVLPSLFLADEHALTSLIAVHVQTIVKVTIGKLSDSVTVRDVTIEVAIVELSFRKGVLTQAFHLAHDPVAFVRLLEAHHLLTLTA